MPRRGSETHRIVQNDDSFVKTLAFIQVRVSPISLPMTVIGHDDYQVNDSDHETRDYKSYDDCDDSFAIVLDMQYLLLIYLSWFNDQEFNVICTIF